MTTIATGLCAVLEVRAALCEGCDVQDSSKDADMSRPPTRTRIRCLKEVAGTSATATASVMCAAQLTGIDRHIISDVQAARI